MPNFIRVVKIQKLTKKENLMQLQKIKDAATFTPRVPLLTAT